mmetsp:Transcript_23439/g.65630  ORF Transcript_23439/g.65630 Transcript_23439/m.65630 type:complete len:249 (+) Transcript_23439:106-852(+)
MSNNLAGLVATEPEPDDKRAVMLTPLVAAGDEHGVRRVLKADCGAVNELGLDGTSPLCAAALWGHLGILRLLLDAMASPGMRNENGPRWTALHAAALQEHGKACMMLLEYKANPKERDCEGVTPCDYASCSEAVWPLFAAKGCERISKAALCEKGVLRKASSALESELMGKASETDQRGVVPEYSRPGSAYVLTREYPPRPGSAMPPGTARTYTSQRSGQLIDILAEEDEQPEDSGHRGSKGLKSLQS